MPPSQVALLQSVMSQQYNYSNGAEHKFHKFLTFHENIFSLYFYNYVKAKMIVHAFMIDLDQPDY